MRINLTVGVLVAAGSALRMGMGINKNLIIINDKPILYYSLLKFVENENIDRVIVVAKKDDYETISKIIREFGDTKKIEIVLGGDTRQKSVYNALRSIVGICEYVVIHDAARPIISNDIINDAIKNAKKFGAATASIKMRDTCSSLDGDFLGDIIDREKLCIIQTPQAFKYELIYEAHNEAIKNDFIATDDSSLITYIGGKVQLSKGAYSNIKITLKEDLDLANKLCK